MIKKHILFAIVSSIFILSCSSTVQPPAYYKYEAQIIGDPSKTALFVNLDTINIEYINNVSALARKEYSDSFYLSAANQIAFSKMSSMFRLSDINLGESRNLIRYSVLQNDTLSKDSASEAIKEIAKEGQADYVVVPYACQIKYSAIQPQSWRNNAGSYEQPIDYSAATEFHIQIWSSGGELLYEKKGISKNGRPMFYNSFNKHRQKIMKDVVSYANKLYSPPMIRSLDDAIKHAVN